MFPTLGQCVEHYLYDDVELMYGVFRAFNSWLDEEWGFNYRGRIYAPPVIPMLDVNRAVQELEWVMSKGARTICLRPGPLPGRSLLRPVLGPHQRGRDLRRVPRHRRRLALRRRLPVDVGAAPHARPPVHPDPARVAVPG
jgi:hypothetical protein